MTRKEIVSLVHMLVLMENMPTPWKSWDLMDEDERANWGSEAAYASYQISYLKDGEEYPPSGPWPKGENPWAEGVDFSLDDASKEIVKGYSPLVNQKILDMDDPPEDLWWGIGEAWIFQVNIPKYATSMKQVTSVGSYGE